MQIVNVEQLSDAWFDLRAKKMTASHAQAIGASGKGLVTYTTQLMQEYYSKAEPERYSGFHTDRGIELEDSAAFMYSMETGIEVRKCGFVIHNEFVGASPDILAGKKGMGEIKCLADKGYFEMLMGGKPDTKYVWQAQMQMLVCEKSWNDLIFFNPNFDEELIIIRINPDPVMFKKLEDGFTAGIEMIREIESKMEKIQGMAK